MIGSIASSGTEGTLIDPTEAQRQAEERARMDQQEQDFRALAADIGRANATCNMPRNVAEGAIRGQFRDFSPDRLQTYVVTGLREYDRIIAAVPETPEVRRRRNYVANIFRRLAESRFRSRGRPASRGSRQGDP